MAAQTVAELLVEIGVKFEDAKKAEKAVEGLEEAVEDTGDEADKAGKKVGHFGKVVKQVADGIRRDVKKKAQASWEDLHKTIAKGAVAIAATVAAATGATVAFVQTQTAAVDATNKLSASIGIGVEELQRLEFAAGQSGVQQEKLRSGMFRFNQELQNLANGATGPAAEAFAKLGVELEDLNGLTRTEQLGLIGDRLNQIEDGAERSATAARLFGEEAGPNFASLLASGTEGLKELTASAKGVFTQEQADQASAYRDRMGELENEVGSLANTVLIELLPTAYDLIVGLRDWLRANDDLIRQKLIEFVRQVVDVLLELGEAVANVIRFIDSMTDAWNRMMDALGPVGDAMGWLFDRIVEGTTPILQLVRTINGLSDALIELGIVSDRVETGKMDGAMDAANAAVRRAQSTRVSSLSRGAPAKPFFEQFGDGIDAVEGVPDMLARPAGGGRGGSGGSRSSGGRAGRALSWLRDAASNVFRPEPPTYEEAIAQFRRGNFDLLSEEIRGMAGRAPDVRDVKPTVAITLTHVEVEQNITSTDPVGAGREAAMKIRELLNAQIAAAEAAVGSNVKR